MRSDIIMAPGVGVGDLDRSILQIQDGVTSSWYRLGRVCLHCPLNAFETQTQQSHYVAAPAPPASPPRRPSNRETLDKSKHMHCSPR